MKYDYLIVYNAKINLGYGFGNIDLILNNKIKSFDDTEEIRKFIQYKNNFEELIIINYKLMRRQWEVKDWIKQMNCISKLKNTFKRIKNAIQ